MNDDDLESGLRRVLSDRSRRVPDALVLLDGVYAGASRRRARRRAASAVAGASSFVLVLAGFGAWHLLENRGSTPPGQLASGATPAVVPRTPTSTGPAQPTAASVTPTPSSQTSARLPVPAAFSPVSVTAIGPSHWWVLGSDGLLATTTDAGATFALTAADGLGRDARVLRFATASDGWAVTGSAAGTSVVSPTPALTLWSTTDGGRTWIGVRGLDGAASSVEAGGGTVFATTQRADGTWSVWASPVGADAWRKIGSLGAIVPSQRPLLAVQSGRAIVVGNNPDKVREWVFSPDGTSSQHAVPCTPDVGAGDLSATSSSVWLVCHNGTGDSLYSSTDATTWSAVPSATTVASRLQVGAIDGIRAAVGLQDGSIRLVATTSTAATLGTGGTRTVGGWSYVAFTNASDGFALDDAGTLLRTTNAGRTWSAVRFR